MRFQHRRRCFAHRRQLCLPPPVVLSCCHRRLRLRRSPPCSPACRIAQALLDQHADVNAKKKQGQVKGKEGAPDMTPLDVVNQACSRTIFGILQRYGGELHGTRAEDPLQHAGSIRSEILAWAGWGSFRRGSGRG